MPMQSTTTTTLILRCEDFTCNLTRRENENIPSRCKSIESVNCFDSTLSEPFSQFPGLKDSQKRKEKNNIINKQRSRKIGKNIARKMQQKEEEGREHKNTFNTIWLLLEAVKIRLSKRRRALLCRGCFRPWEGQRSRPTLLTTWKQIKILTNRTCCICSCVIIVSQCEHEP